MAGYYAKSEADFPDPHRFGAWWNEHRFQVYRNLSLVKSAVTTHSDSNGVSRHNVKIYEHDGYCWQLIYEITKGENKNEHELWKKGPAPKTLAVSDESVDAAITSILEAIRDEATGG